MMSISAPLGRIRAQQQKWHGTGTIGSNVRATGLLHMVAMWHGLILQYDPWPWGGRDSRAAPLDWVSAR
jgi:hypothetical protein